MPDTSENTERARRLVRSSIMRVKPEWLDYNGHLNMAYYNVLFDQGVDEAAIPLGLGPEYLDACQGSFFTAEVHVCYLRELASGDPVYSTFQLIDFDDKRMHFYQELFHAEEGWISATSEQLALHIDMTAKKVTPWPEAIRAALGTLHASQATLAVPERVGRKIAIRRK
ncbi:thioesterase family protein [Breoghania sp. L-A4]|uniref:thioesterase family protein n=1 Tax=Breoghania sp. L-A4 TaxID=2304600 RepID=UPI000E35B2CB|nr:thioesterase family protein [Breoghania sp. L-A4]AXS41312.1 thioesterase [Breoghania sp. L-A4]